MDARQLTESGRQLIKAFDGGDPPSTLLTLLSPLEKWTPTEDLLRASKIGVAVAKVRASKDPKVASTASRLVNQWKAAVKTKKPGATNGTGSPAPVKKEPAMPAPKKYSVAPEKRTAKEDGVDTALTGNSTRDSCIVLIYNGLVFMSEEAPSDILAVAASVETAAYEEYKPETSPAYKQKIRSLFSNLKMKTSGPLRKDVFSGVIEPRRFVTMTSEELKSDDKRRSDAALEKENMRLARAAQEEKAISTTYVTNHPFLRTDD